MFRILLRLSWWRIHMSGFGWTCVFVTEFNADAFWERATWKCVATISSFASTQPNRTRSLRFCAQFWPKNCAKSIYPFNVCLWFICENTSTECRWRCFCLHFSLDRSIRGQRRKKYSRSICFRGNEKCREQEIKRERIRGLCYPLSHIYKLIKLSPKKCTLKLNYRSVCVSPAARSNVIDVYKQKPKQSQRKVHSVKLEMLCAAHRRLENGEREGGEARAASHTK